MQPKTSRPDIAHKAVTSVKWSMLIEVITRTFQPIVYLILARLLTPQDFGVMSTALIAINFCQIFWEAGFGKALVQTNSDLDKAANVVFWMNVVLGLSVYALLFTLSPYLATFFNSPASNAVIRVVGLQVVIGSLSVVQQALLERDLGFHRLMRIRFTAAISSGIVSIVLATQGAGVWSLVIGNIGASLVNLVMMWSNSKWHPVFSIDWQLGRKLIGFSIWMISDSLIAWLMTWGDNLIVGKFLGVQVLGVYQLAWSIVMAIFGLALNPIQSTLYPMFSRMQDNVILVKAGFEKANRVVLSVGLPMGIGLLLVGPDIAAFLFGNRWTDLGFVVGVIGMMFGIASLTRINQDVYRALGRPDSNAKLMLVQMLFYFPIFLLAAPYGLHMFAIARLAVAVIALPMHVYLCVRTLKVSPFYLWHMGKPMFLSALIMAVTLSLLRWLLSQTPMTEALIIIISLVWGMGIYGAAMWLLDKTFVLDTKGLALKALSRSH